MSRDDPAHWVFAPMFGERIFVHEQRCPPTYVADRAARRIAPHDVGELISFLAHPVRQLDGRRSYILPPIFPEDPS